MRNVLYVIAVILIIIWAVGVASGVGRVIHLLLVIAALSVLFGIILRKKTIE